MALVPWLIGLSVITLVVLLNRRAAREEVLLRSIGAALHPRDLRGRIAVRVHCALFFRRAVATVDMRLCESSEVWDVTARLGRILPPHVSLVVNGSVDGRSVSLNRLSSHGASSVQG